MGLLDQIAGAIDGERGGASGQNQIMLVAMELLQNHPGGLQGIIEQFTRAGLLGQHRTEPADFGRGPVAGLRE
jgi:hypothetical protein